MTITWSWSRVPRIDYEYLTVCFRFNFNHYLITRYLSSLISFSRFAIATLAPSSLDMRCIH